MSKLNSASRTIGATAIEYGLIVALIAVVIITAVTALGGSRNDRQRAFETQPPAASAQR